MKPSKFRWRLWLVRTVVTLILIPILWVVLYTFLTPPITALMVSRTWDRWSAEDPYLLQHRTVSLDSISPQLAIAVISGEDQLFLQHDGFDVKAIEKALEHNKNHRKKRGASTISQQTAKNAFLWEGRSWLRKGLEVPFTLLMETLWSKRRILEVYLNIVEFGPGIYGAEAAAQHWFHKSAKRLTSEEAARLAAMLPSPLRCNPKAPTGKYASRVSWVHRQMAWQDQAAILQELAGNKKVVATGSKTPEQGTPTKTKPKSTIPPPSDTLDAPRDSNQLVGESPNSVSAEDTSSEEPVLDP